jgi:hypothetical protein
MERFFNEKSLGRYRQLANGTLTAAERRTVFALLSDNETTYRGSPRQAIRKSCDRQSIDGQEIVLTTRLYP